MAMEWVTPVNEMLHEEITKINHTLVPPGLHGDVRSARVMQESLSKAIDVLGEQSAAAQGLNKVITTSDRLRNAPAHFLYLLKDSNAKGGKGDVIGLLKVGRKHLFLFDERDQVREVEPLCVLDFFVLQDYQRHGYGRMLFDHMLQDMQAKAHELAVDGPSPKMESFLVKNYGVERLMRQSNNFAISPQFFDKGDNEISVRRASAYNPTNVRYSGDGSKSGRTTPALSANVGRFAAPKPPSAIATVIHGGGYNQETKNGAVSGRGTPEESKEPRMPERRPSLAAKPAPAPEPEPAPQPQPSPLPPAAEARPMPERPSSLRVDTTPAAGVPTPSPGGSLRRDSQLTDRGFFDVKFYHNRLW